MTKFGDMLKFQIS